MVTQKEVEVGDIAQISFDGNIFAHTVIIINTGKMGCPNCYDVFESELDPIIKRIQGTNRHVGRIGKIIDNKIDKKYNKGKTEENTAKKEEKTRLEQLQEELKTAIKEERYEDAAKIRDEIKKNEKENK